MTGESKWPDPNRPGVPLNPERKGCHYLIHPNDLDDGLAGAMPAYWNGTSWWLMATSRPIPSSEMGSYTYRGACPTAGFLDYLQATLEVDIAIASEKNAIADHDAEEPHTAWEAGHAYGLKDGAELALARLKGLRT
jgi:hypothetical protein